MVQSYLDWFITFIESGISWMAVQMVVPGVSLLAFLIAVALLCIILGGLMIR